MHRHGGAAAFSADRELQSQLPCCFVQIPDSSVCTEIIEFSQNAPFSPNAVVTIRTLGQEKRQFLISDMMRMSVAQHRQIYKVGHVRLVTGCCPVSHWLHCRLARQTYKMGYVRPAGWDRVGACCGNSLSDSLPEAAHG